MTQTQNEIAKKEKILAAESRKKVYVVIKKCLQDQKRPDEIVNELKGSIALNNVLEEDAINIIWECVISAIEWDKKENLVQDHAIRHLRQYISVFAAFVITPNLQTILLNRIQEYCYENMNFLKTFNKIVLLMYKSDVLSEATLIKWYKSDHSPRGWYFFMDQMRIFIEWLEKSDENMKKNCSLQSIFTVTGTHPMIEKSKLKLGLKATISVALDSKKDLEPALLSLINHPTCANLITEREICTILQNNPELFNNINLIEKLWFCQEFQPTILELIFEKYPQYFIDEAEDYIIHHLKLRIQEHESDKDLGFLPKFLHFCSTSKKAFQNLQDILLTCAEEVDYDNRTVNFFSELVYKVHLLPGSNPIDLYSPHIQPLIALLLIPPESNGINEKVSNQIIKWWTQTLEEYPSEGRKLAILFLPWLHKLSCDNVDFQIYMKLYQQ